MFSLFERRASLTATLINALPTISKDPGAADGDPRKRRL